MGTNQSTFLSFELLLALYLFSGVYKADPRFSLIPIDLTALLGVLSVCAAGYIIYKNDSTTQLSRDALLIVSVFYAMVGYAALSFVWSPSSSYALSKLFEVAVLTGWPLIATAVIIAPSQRRRARFFYALLAVALWILAETALSGLILGRPGHLTAFGTDNYIGVSRALGVGVLIATYYGVIATRRVQKLTWSGVVFSGMFVMLWVGARGPFLALLGGIVVLLVLLAGTRTTWQEIWPAYTRVSSTILAAVVAGVITGTRTVRRLSLLDGLVNLPLTGGRSGGSASSGGATASTASGSDVANAVGSSTASRLDFYSAAVDYWQSAPIQGNGFGSFAVLYEGVDTRKYPHNIVLETLAELGVVGGLLLLIVFLYPVVKLTRIGWTRLPDHAIVAFALACYAGANAMVTGDLGTNRQLFAAIGLLLFPLGNR